MHCPLSAFLLLAHCLCSQALDITEGSYPILWEKVPERLDELPIVEGMTTVQPWDYLQRMTLYKVILNNTDKYMSYLGFGSLDNVLWSLPLQLAWKLKSGRLIDPTGVTTCGQETGDPMCISPQSWWACVNYYLSVVPFLAAVETGLVAEGFTVQIQAPSEENHEYCTSYSDCSVKHPELMLKWEMFFQALKNLSASDIADPENKDQMLGWMWEAEQSSLQSSSKCDDLRKHYSFPEQSFSRSWIDSAEYMAATHFPSGIAKSLPLLAPLPSRVLQQGDKPPNINDLTKEENHTLYIFSWMETTNTFLGGNLKSLWRRAMCSVTTREKGQEVLQELVLNPKYAIRGLLLIITEMTISC